MQQVDPSCLLQTSGEKMKNSDDRIVQARHVLLTRGTKVPLLLDLRWGVTQPLALGPPQQP